MESARAAIQKALSLNPDNAPAHYSRAIMRIVYEHDPKGAMADIDAAQRSDPNVTKPFELVIVTGCHSGPCFQKYIREVSRDLELDPLNANTMLTRGWAYRFADNPTASIADLRRALELNPGIDAANYMLACALIAEHRFPEALAAAQAETNPLNHRTALALAYLALGRRAEADAMIKELLANDSKNGPLQIAEVYSFAGNKTAALNWMERYSVLRCRPFSKTSIIRAAVYRSLEENRHVQSAAARRLRSQPQHWADPLEAGEMCL